MINLKCHPIPYPRIMQIVSQPSKRIKYNIRTDFIMRNKNIKISLFLTLISASMHFCQTWSTDGNIYRAPPSIWSGNIKEQNVKTYFISDKAVKWIVYSDWRQATPL